MRFGRLLMVIATALSLSRTSHAAQLELEYTTVENCPARDEFVRQLLARTRSQAAIAATRMRLTFLPYLGGYTVRLLLSDSNGNRVERELSGENCAELSNAIALIAAVTIDGSAVPEAPMEQNATSASSPGSATNPAERPKAHVAVPRNSEEHRAVAALNKPKEVRNLPSRTSISLGPSFGIRSATAPLLLPFLGIALSLEPKNNRHHAAYRLSAQVGQDRQTEVVYQGRREGIAQFQWVSGRIAACPVAYAFGSMRIGPCAGVELGALRGMHQNSKRHGSSTGVWLAPAAQLEGGVTVAGFELRLTGAAFAPLVRDRFLLHPDIPVFRASVLGYSAEVVGAWSFH